MVVGILTDAGIPVRAETGTPPEIVGVLSADQTIDPGEAITYDVEATGVDDSATAWFSGDGLATTIVATRGSRLRLSVAADPMAGAGLRDLTVANPDGLADTLPDAILVTGDAPPTAGSLAGRIFGDTNRNGVEDGAETGIAGVAIAVVDSLGQEWHVVSGADGTYLVEGVPIGMATATGAAPAGYVATTANETQVLEVFEGATIAAEPIGYAPSPVGAISGTVFVDGNENGVDDEGEEGLSGVVVSVADGVGGLWTATTGGAGTYVVEDLPLGDVSVTVAAPAGFAVTTGNTSQTIVVLEGSTAVVDPVGLAAVELALPGVYLVEDVHFLLDARSLGHSDGDPVAVWVDEVAGIEFAAVDGQDEPTYRATMGFGGRPSVEFDGVNDILQATFGKLNTGDVVFHLVLETVTYGHRTVVMTKHPSGDLSTKHVLAYDDYDEERTLRGEQSWVTMSGPDGSQAQHYHPIMSPTIEDPRASPTDDVTGGAHRVVITYVVRESGQVRFWDRLDDILDESMAAPGNNLDVGIRLGAREDSNPSSFGNFRLAYLLVLNEVPYTEDDLLAAAADLAGWFNVPLLTGSEPSPQL